MFQAFKWKTLLKVRMFPACVGMIPQDDDARCRCSPAGLGVLTFLLSCIPLQLHAQLVINEIMPIPSTGMPEWVEVLNVGDDTVDCTLWTLRDASGSRCSLGALGRLPPRALAVAASGPGLEAAVPAFAGNIHIIPQLPSLNNSGDDLVLIDPVGTQSDSVVYRSGWGYEAGRSLERSSGHADGTVRTSWSACRDPARMTPCARNSTAQADLDALLDPLLVLGEPRAGESVAVATVVKNPGRLVIPAVDVTVYLDANGDGLPEPAERVLDGRWTQLQPGDSLRIDWVLQPSSAEKMVVFSEIRADGDERADNDARIDTVRILPARGSVVINEIMYAPEDGDPEWIELFNASQRPVDLTGWQIADNSSWKDVPPTVISAGDYLVLASSSTLLDKHPELSARLMVIALPSLNNGGDQVRLRPPNSAVVDSLAYLPEWGGTDSRSLERIDDQAPAGDRRNWSGSLVLRGTPGRKNGNAIRDKDVAIQCLVPSSESIARVRVRNAGRRATEPASLRMVDDTNRNGYIDAGERSSAFSIPGIAAGDSLDVDASDGRLHPGRRRWIAVAELTGDERADNDTLRFIHDAPLPSRGLIVNEIMSAPFPAEAEWIELLNVSDQYLPLDGVILGDEPTPGGGRTVHRIQSAATVPPQGFALIASDSSVFGRYPELRAADGSVAVLILNRALALSEAADAVAVIDPTGSTVDSVRYAAAWHHPEIGETTGRSLERMHPSLPGNHSGSWTTCPSTRGGTPGARNASWVDVEARTGTAALSIQPNPFSPDGDGREDVCVIAWRLAWSDALVRVRVFDTAGRLVRTLAPGVLSGAESSVLFDGFDEQRRRMEIGMYIVLVESTSRAGGMVEAMKAVVVVGGRLR